MERNDFIEKIVGGVFGAVAIAAAIVELLLEGLSAAGIVAAIKDIAGTAVVIILLISFINEHKKAKGIRGSIEAAMVQLENGYAPMIRKAEASENSGVAKKNKLEKTVRYEIAVNTDALFGTQCNNFSPFFDVDLDAPTSASFYIRKKFFGEKQEVPFAANDLFDKISQYMTRQHEGIQMTFVPDASGGKAVITFATPIKYEKDVKWLVKVVDDMIFVYTMLQEK